MIKTIKKIFTQIVIIILAINIFLPANFPVAAASAIDFSLKVANVTQGDVTWANSNVASPNETVKFLLTIRNTTSQGLENTILKISLPAGIFYVPGSTYAYSKTGKYLQPDGITTSGINMGRLAADITQYLTITARISENASGNLTASATAKADGANLVSASAVINITGVTPPPDLGQDLSITAKLANVSRGDFNWEDIVTASPTQDLKLLLSLRNNSVSSVENTILHVTLPAGLTYIPGSTFAYGASGKYLQPDGITTTGINMGRLASDITQYVTLSFRVNQNAPGGDLVVLGSIKADNQAEKTDTAKIVIASAGSFELVSGNTTVVADGVSSTTLVIKMKDSAGQILPGQPVNFSVFSGGGSVNPASATTNSNGQVSFTYTANTVSGTAVIKIQANGFSGNIDITKISGPTSASKSTISVSQSSIAVSGFISVQVVLRDKYNNLVTGSQVRLYSSRGSSIDTISPETANSGSPGYHEGIANFVITSSTIGQATLTAKDLTNNVTLSTSETITFTAGNAVTLEKVSGDNQIGYAGTALVSPFVVRAKDAFGNPVSGQEINFTIKAGNGSLLPNSATTNSSGEAGTILTLGRTPGNNKVWASSGSLETIEFNATGIVGPPAEMTYVSGNSQSDKVGTTISDLIVRITDQYSNAVSGVRVNFSISSRPAGDSTARLSASSAISDSTGLARITFTLGSKPGIYRVQANVSGLSGSPVTFESEALVGDPANLEKLAGDNQSAMILNLLANPLKVKVTDIFGNPIKNSSITFSFSSVPAGASGQAFQPSATVFSNSSGEAEVNVKLGDKGGVYIVSAAVSGASLVTFTETANALDHYNIAIDSLEQAAGVGFTAIVTARTATNDVLVLENGVIDIATSGSLKSYTDDTYATETTTATLVSGAATIYLKDLVAEVVTVTVTKRGSTERGTSANITIVPAERRIITKISGDNQTGDSLLPLGEDFVVEVKDIYGNNVLNGTEVNFSVTSAPLGAADYALNPENALTSGGRATSRLTLGNIAGNYIVTVSASGADSVIFSAVAEPQLSLRLVSGLALVYSAEPGFSDDTKETVINIKSNATGYVLNVQVDQLLSKLGDPTKKIDGDPDTQSAGFGWSNDDGIEYSAFTTSPAMAIGPGVENSTNTYTNPTPVGGKDYRIRYKLKTDWTIIGANYSNHILYTLVPSF